MAADNFDDAKLKAKALPEYKKRRMHVDGLQEITAVSGCHVRLDFDASLNGESVLVGSRHRDLAPAGPLQPPSSP